MILTRAVEAENVVMHHPSEVALVSIIVPVLNEEQAVGIFLDAVTPILKSTGMRYELVFVDDGSTDNTSVLLRVAHQRMPEVKLVSLSRNFGKEAALTAGIAHASGDAIIPIDVDLQDPPEVIPALLSKWREGFEIVFAARANRDSDSYLKRKTAGWFYQLMGQISETSLPENVGDFRLMDRAAVNALLSFPERKRVMKVLMSAVGFRTATVYYERQARSAGRTKFRPLRLWSLALDAIVASSTLPLRLWTYFGGLVALGALTYGAFIVVRTLLQGSVVPGYASLMSVVLFLGGLQFLSLGILGEYVGRIAIEVRGRPLYIVGDTVGFNGPAQQNSVPNDWKSPSDRA